MRLNRRVPVGTHGGVRGRLSDYEGLLLDEKSSIFLKKSLDISSASRYNNTRRQGHGLRRKEYADVAELADALDSGSSSLKRVWVQIPSSAPKEST